MEMLPFLLKEIAPIRIFGQELFTFVFLYRLLITYPLKTFRYRMPRIESFQQSLDIMKM